MEGYDPTAMPYLGNPLSFNNPVTNPDYLTSLPALGISEHHQYHQQQHPAYSTDNYGTTSSHNIPSLPLPIPPEVGREFTSSGYDDFSYESAPQDVPDGQEPPVPDSNTSVDRDDELLSFNPPTYNFTLLDYSLQRKTVSMNARLHGMFFMADPPSTPGIYPQVTPELTCYRRNLFQVTGSITLPRNLHYILTNDGNRIPIMALELCVSATESVEGSAVKLISVPWKTPANNAPAVPEDKTEKEPTSIPLDIMSNQDMDADFATFPIAWKRLQFRVATANNGRRKELQQHFVARLKLVATLANGSKVPIVEARSAAIVVRGRSPRNFQQRKDLALGGDKSSVRKGPNSPAMPTRRATTDTTPARSPLKRERSGDNPFAPFSFSATDVRSQGSNAFSGGWHRSSHGSSSAPALPTPTFKTPTLPSNKSTDSASPPSVQQPLTFGNDDLNTCPSTQRPAKQPRTNSSENRPFPNKYPSLPSPRTLLSGSQPQPHRYRQDGADPADSLYEYFPLSTDDWQPPVDAVYRPHVVHHVSMAANSAAPNGKPGIASRSKRYFSENVS